ncbi:carbohydrate sulfotransferase 4-like [Trichosurus vulpecula]|uniref:carbohydrate sulfotransferase 4-like n=1 Tax=Trichosurus vulpecula TaxID=9337 RepID=UPI00186ACCC4|nr:carbohydrate sulfotransferase 4-like [Trichosurus vulpecula]
MEEEVTYKGIKTTSYSGVQALLVLLSSSRSPKNPRAVQVLILSSWRSGSSLMGQFFSQHPDVFYLMEPSWHVWLAFSRSSAAMLQGHVQDLVRSIFLCDMTVLGSYLAPGSRGQSDLFMWETSRALCSPPACGAFPRGAIVSGSACRPLCRKQPFSGVEKACRSYSHVVLKEVRFFNLQGLYPLLTDPAFNLHVVHLVRDPRAVFCSRERTKGKLMLDDRILLGQQWSRLKAKDRPYYLMKAICQSQQEIYEAAQQLEGPLRRRYLLMRYEDLVREPLVQVSQLYNFSRLQVLPQLQSWVQFITRGQGLGNDSFYPNSRDGHHVSQAWRWSLPYKKVARLQAICGDFMSLMGYRPVLSEQELKNLSLDLLSSQRPAQLRSPKG